jgi:hypothetical protein
MAKINIEGTHLRWFIIGAMVRQQMESNRGDQLTIDCSHSSEFNHQLSDTCNRVHKYLTSGAQEGLGGGASDLQCRIGLEARQAFGVKLGDSVEVFW